MLKKNLLGKLGMENFGWRDFFLLCTETRFEHFSNTPNRQELTE